MKGATYQFVDMDLGKIAHDTKVTNKPAEVTFALPWSDIRDLAQMRAGGQKTDFEMHNCKVTTIYGDGY